ncbi:MAG TPA: DUF2281 domain-containing protein [Flavobacteriales bacterium]|nr:DUF2281 domain-containing protein [Flavobacteriales bacterium]
MGRAVHPRTGALLRDDGEPVPGGGGAGAIGAAYLRGLSTHDQYIQLSSLPEDVRRQVLDFIDFLMLRPDRTRKEPAKQNGKKPISGLLKGKIRIADDFDAPLDDFKEYME